MEQHKGKIGQKEYVAIVILAIGTKLADDTPAIFYHELENAAWMIPLLAGLLTFIPILLLLKVYSKYPNTSLMDIFQKLLGKNIGYLLVLTLWLFGFCLNVFDTSIYTDIIGTMYFTETPTIIIYTILMAVSAYGAKKGLEQIGSVAWAFLPYIKISLLVALVLALAKGNLQYIFPLFGPGKLEVIKESSLKLSIYCDLLYIGVLSSYISTNKVLTKGTLISLIILIIEFPLSIIAYLSLFDYESVRLLNYPFHETIRYISMGFLTNIETFFFPFWLVASFVRFSIYLYVNAVMFGWLFKIKHFEYLIPTFATLLVILGMVPETPTFSMVVLKEKILNLITPAFFFLPVLLWIRAIMKGRKENEKSSV